MRYRIPRYGDIVITAYLYVMYEELKHPPLGSLFSLISIFASCVSSTVSIMLSGAWELTDASQYGTRYLVRFREFEYRETLPLR